MITTKLRIPLKEQYSYLESEIATETIAEAHDMYVQAMKYINGEAGLGLSDKEFNLFLDRQLCGDPGNTVDQYESMSPAQQAIIQANKRSIARLKSREEIN